MKKKLTKTILFVLSLGALLLSCRNIEVSDEDDFNSKYSSKSTADIYIETLFARDELCTARNAAEYDYPDFFYELEIIDSKENKIMFSNLTENEKEIFVKIWKNKITENIDEKTKIQSDAVDVLRNENLAFLKALYSTTPRKAVMEKNISAVMEKYKENLEKLNKTNAQRSLIKREPVTNDNLNNDSLKVFMDNYKRGRILISLDSASSSSALGLGHASLMDNENIYIKNNTSYTKGNSLDSWSISSYPQTISSEWAGQRNGVQFEPLGLWVGKDSGSCSEVRIYDMQKVVWVWDWFNSGYRKYPANENDYGAAADYAENSMGIGYGILSKESRSLIYCSALVWQSWRYLDRSYDMSAGFQVFPAEIANSMQTKLVAAYSNK